MELVAAHFSFFWLYLHEEATKAKAHGVKDTHILAKGREKCVGRIGLNRLLRLVVILRIKGMKQQSFNTFSGSIDSLPQLGEACVSLPWRNRYGSLSQRVQMNTGLVTAEETRQGLEFNMEKSVREYLRRASQALMMRDMGYECVQGRVLLDRYLFKSENDLGWKHVCFGFSAGDSVARRDLLATATVKSDVQEKMFIQVIVKENLRIAVSLLAVEAVVIKGPQEFWASIGIKVFAERLDSRFE
ncbi:hypothetical protein YC2023_016811 [Brassica napus]